MRGGGGLRLMVLDVDRQSAIRCNIIGRPHHAHLTARRGRRDIVPPHGGLIHSACASRESVDGDEERG